MKCVVIARYFQLYIAISRVPALENSIARAIVIIVRTIFLCLQKRHFWASTHHTC